MNGKDRVAAIFGRCRRFEELFTSAGGGAT
jgi:hypothetical protein